MGRGRERGAGRAHQMRANKLLMGFFSPLGQGPCGHPASVSALYSGSPVQNVNFPAPSRSSSRFNTSPMSNKCVCTC